MTQEKNQIVQLCEACFKEISDKLSRWITLLGISGKNTKKQVRDEMKDFLKRQIREGGETR